MADKTGQPGTKISNNESSKSQNVRKRRRLFAPKRISLGKLRIVKDNATNCNVNRVTTRHINVVSRGMNQHQFYESVVEPSTERLALFGIAHEVVMDGRNFVVSHKVSKNVLTDFDAKLSRYLAAVTGTGLPGATVETRIKDIGNGRSWNPYPAKFVPSIPHALSAAAKLALGVESAVHVKIGAWMNDGMGQGQEYLVSSDTIETLEKALDVCAQIGSVDFLEISGDFERVLARPRGTTMDMMVMDLQRGTISIPSVSEMGGSAWQGPLFGFEKAVNNAPAITSFLARARHAVAVAKEDAIHAFRESAETRIMGFNDALDGRQLSGYRLDSATSLVARLQAGLGDTLLGLSEAAQMTALDWASQVRQLPAIAKQRPDDGRPEIPHRPRLVGGN